MHFNMEKTIEMKFSYKTVFTIEKHYIHQLHYEDKIFKLHYNL